MESYRRSGNSYPIDEHHSARSTTRVDCSCDKCLIDNFSRILSDLWLYLSKAAWIVHTVTVKCKFWTMVVSYDGGQAALKLGIRCWKTPNVSKEKIILESFNSKKYVFFFGGKPKTLLSFTHRLNFYFCSVCFIPFIVFILFLHSF